MNDLDQIAVLCPSCICSCQSKSIIGQHSVVSHDSVSGQQRP